MKAVMADRYGTPDVLKIREVKKPVPGDNEILIKVYESIVTPSDCAFRKADPFITRFFSGLLKPKSIHGVELAGIVEETGKEITSFKKGDPIFGTCGIGFGAHSEYKCLTEKDVAAVKPENIDFGAAAGVCDGGLTALYFLRNMAKLKKNDSILINGASGSVGSFAIQLAKHYGAEVTAVCSSTNMELVRSLGADFVIDYTKENFTESGKTYDVIFDAVGKETYSRCKKSLKSRGLYMTTVPTLPIMLQMLFTAKSRGRRAIFAASGLKQTRDNLNFLKDLIESGNLKSIVDRRFPLEQIADAHRYVDKGHKKGNVVITMTH